MKILDKKDKKRKVNINNEITKGNCISKVKIYIKKEKNSKHPDNKVCTTGDNKILLGMYEK